MSKLRTVGGILRLFLQQAKEDWDVMDHKLMRIAGGLIGFIVMGLLWYYFFRKLTPF